MKLKILIIFSFLFSDLFCFAQVPAPQKSNILNNDCPPPPDKFNILICADVSTRAKVESKELEYYEYFYEKRLWEFACINIKLDNEETIKYKLKRWWDKYKKNCKCDSLDFSLSNGNLLKYALSQKMPEVIETLASTYGLDINFIDPADGLNLLDYVTKEIEHLKKLGNSEASVKVYEEYKAGIIGLGGKSNKK